MKKSNHAKTNNSRCHFTKGLATALIATPFAIRAQQSPLRARVKIDTERTIGEIDLKIYGNFIKHLGRCIDGGVFEENSPLSDSNGFRKAENDFGVTKVKAASSSAKAEGRKLRYRFAAHSYMMLKAKLNG